MLPDEGLAKSSVNKAPLVDQYGSWGNWGIVHFGILNEPRADSGSITSARHSGGRTVAT